MSALPEVDLSQGACVQLPIEVVDKYFGANPHQDAFRHFTARVICSQCVVREQCLTAAISDPGVLDLGDGNVRAGLSGDVLRKLRRRHFLRGVPTDQLTRQTLMGEQDVLDVVNRSPGLRTGQFPDAELLV